jgi:hypothetical protein
MSKLNELEEIGKASPVIQDESNSYIYAQHSNLYLLAITRKNVNAAAILVFLHKLIEIFKHYFQEVRQCVQYSSTPVLCPPKCTAAAGYGLFVHCLLPGTDYPAVCAAA